MSTHPAPRPATVLAPLRVLCLAVALLVPATALAGPSTEGTRAHPALRVGVVLEAKPPFDVVGNDERYEGISADFLALVAQRVGFTYEVHYQPDRGTALARLERGEIDLVPSMSVVAGRRSPPLVSTAYLQAPTVEITRRDRPALDSAANERPKVAVERGSALREVVTRLFPKATTVTASDVLAALRSVADGHVDAYVGSYALASWLTEHHQLANLTVRRPVVFDNGLHFAVRRDGAVLRDEIDRAIASITPDERDRILRRWMPQPVTLATGAGSVELNAAQQAWIAAHPGIRVGYLADNAPLSEYGPDEAMHGLFAAQLSLLRERLGLKLATPQAYSASELQTALALGEIDVALINRGDGLDAIALFAGPLLITPTVTVTRVNADFFRGPEQYVGKTVAIRRGHFVAPILRRTYPGIRIIEYDGLHEMLNAVVRGEAMAAFADMVTVAGPLGGDYEGVLKVAGAWLATPSEYGIAVRAEWPELASLMQLGLASITAQEQVRLQKEWLAQPSDRAVPWRKFLTLGLPFLACLGAALGIALIWNRKLHGEVERRTTAEAALAAARDKASVAADRLTGFLAALSDEIRTPMNGVTGLVDVLSHSRLDPEQRYQLGVVARSARMALDVLGDALDLAKAESGGLALCPCPTDPRLLAEGVAALLAPLAAERELELQLAIAPLLPVLYIDGARVRQIIANLTTRALCNTERGFVSIAMSGEALSTHRWRLTVTTEDGGPEFPEATLGRLFRRQGRPMHGNPGEVDLRLAICEALTDAMGGTLEWSKLPGAGNRYCFSVDAEASPQPAESDRPFANVDVRVLCANVFWRNEVCAWLRAWGANVLLDADATGRGHVTVSDGAPALLGQPWVLLTGDLSVSTERGQDRNSKVMVIAQPLLPGRLREALAIALEPEIPDTTLAPCGASGRKVLVVDDESLNLRVARELLELLGFDPVTASESQAGFEQFCASSFEAILLDYHMPGEDGISLAARMRMRERNRRLKPTPILAVTGDGSEAARSASMAAGIDYLLLKPLTLDSLYQALSELACNPERPVNADRNESDDQDEPPPLAYLVELLGSVQRARGIADGFVAASTKDVAALNEKLEEGNCGAARFLAHRIKGGARNAGFGTVGDVAAALESAAKRKDLDVCSTGARRLAAELERLRIRLERIPLEE